MPSAKGGIVVVASSVAKSGNLLGLPCYPEKANQSVCLVALSISYWP